MTTSYDTPPIAVAYMAAWLVAEVRLAPVDREPCAVCGLDGAVTTCAVYGDSDSTTSDLTRCCLHCVEPVAERAHAEQRPTSRRPIVIELDQEVNGRAS